jgi:two-component sensor histidine kinase
MKGGIWMPTANPPPDAVMLDPSGPHRPIGWRTTAAGDSIALSPEWTLLTGLSGAQAPAADQLDRVHPDDRDAIAQAWERAQAMGMFDVDVRVRVTDGGYRWFRAQALPVADAQWRWAGTAIDVSDLHHRLKGETRLRATLHHRIRNALAVIRSLARRSAENSETVDEYRRHFDGRFAAFARTQSHIMRTGDGGVDLEALLVDELLANQVGARAHYSGPEVRLPPRLADQLGLALHELTDNAVQYGAFSRDDGRLEVRWSLTGESPDRIFRLDWHEALRDGGIVAPQTEGLGLELLTRSLHYEVDAEVVLDFADRGLMCSITLPFDRR